MMKKKTLPAVLLAVISVMFLFTSCQKSEPVKKDEIKKPNQFGLAVGDLIEVCDTLQSSQTLSDILLPHSVAQQKINEIEKEALKIFPLRQLKTGRELFIYAQWDTVETVKYFVYKEDPVNFVVFDLRDTIKVVKMQRPFTLKQIEVNGTISQGLILDLKAKNISDEVGFAVADIYESQIDFGMLQENDTYSILFEEIYIDDKPVEVGKILAAKFNFRKKDFFAFRFDKEKAGMYFDENGKGLQGMFLTAPIKFRYRITSKYSSNRYHPILHRNKAHLGTDYAAAAGTPIQTVASGIVSEAGYSGGNGNYVKVKHNVTYTTQYLHMSRIGKGIRRGTHVTQGQTIGYVGSTGLATGPHVCFRFWKNGKQVNPLKERYQSSGPVSRTNRSEFESVKKIWMEKLTGIKG
jgi:murein DD-endopeptidase MepM/ murein hydrolase activator NlpD